MPFDWWLRSDPMGAWMGKTILLKKNGLMYARPLCGVNPR